MNISKILGIFLILNISLVIAKPAETVSSIQVINYKNDLAYLINGPITVVGSDYKDACSKLASYGYVWKIVPTTDVNPACYSPTNYKIMGANTWYCADGSIAYYNSPWWLCTASFNTCPSPGWTRSADGLSCSRSSLTCTDSPATVSELKLLAALVYGEASIGSTYEEKAAIANAVVRFRNSYKYNSVNTLIAKKPYYSAAVHDNVTRYRQVMCSNVEIEYPDLYNAALNALDSEGVDYADGGCFWDGYDLKKWGKKHPHYPYGYKFTDPSHDVMNIGNSDPAGIKGKNAVYNYTYESTIGYGHTVIWKYTQEFMSAEGVRQCR